MTTVSPIRQQAILRELSGDDITEQSDGKVVQHRIVQPHSPFREMLCLIYIAMVILMADGDGLCQHEKSLQEISLHLGPYINTIEFIRYVVPALAVVD